MKALLPLALLFVVTTLRAADAGSAPATVTREADLVVLTLQPEAEQRLRLKVVPVERRAVPAVRKFSGDVVWPLSTQGETAPLLGGTLAELLQLADLQIQADNRVAQAQVQVDVTQIAFERAEKMLKAEAGSVRAVDEARAALGMAEAALQTAKAQREILGGPVGKAGAANRAWVRVAIYSGEAALLDPQADAAIGMLTDTKATLRARRVDGPPTANALANTVDWYFELPTESPWRAGERVAVEIPTRDSQAEQLVLPFNAVLHDIHGGEWVYEQTGVHTYSRRRVQVARLAGTDAVLATGPPVGSKIVTDGSAELFGTEFMTGK